MTAINGHAPHYGLHLENLSLRDKNKELRKQLRVYETERVRKEQRSHCVYCGAPAKRSVCHAHSDLLDLDDGAPR